ncbi:MAG: hypothetical protein LBI70_03660 [Rickettsiales bacterium]|jgi:hypothetical protein|nr:hypothetical protein [Rickettsiales bacterium]
MGNNEFFEKKLEDNEFLRRHEIFEKKLVGMLLAGEQELFVRLRKQYEEAVVTKRQFDSGFYTVFEVQEKSPIIDNKSFIILDVFIDYNGQEKAYGFNFFVDNGVINYLEGFPFIYDDWINWSADDYDKIDDMYYGGERLGDKLHIRDTNIIGGIGSNIPIEYLGEFRDNRCDHKLDELLEPYGGDKHKLAGEVTKKLSDYVKKHKIVDYSKRGNYITVDINGINIEVRGGVVDGETRIGSMYIRTGMLYIKVKLEICY